ncbi:hypothetical protein PGTUg99_017037 [Puccinia graminis f. sp. tritici]|uniref:SWIM-type domain-containing protein n=1 Tax=Puccinia graminis f. sp. tritici TaxID=56615 RepID=A0A5B0P4A9_PUCGR|nr:hypothetical protein PGTUg99_017037 [Puccinia graminis f. sp. tritici]
MKRPASQFYQPSYPLVKDIYEIVPLPFTEVIPVKPNQKADPNSLRMIRRVHGCAPSFPEPIHCFTIPGRTLSDAEAFVTAMQATVYWSSSRSHRHTPLQTPPSGKTGRPAEHHFRLEYKCPRGGIHEATPNSRKKKTLSRKCGCKSRFSIFHHIRTDTLRVEWDWRHNHNPYSVDEVQQNRCPEMVEKWLTDRVISGLNWKSILQLMRSPEILEMDSDLVTPEAGIVKYDHVRHLIRTRMGVLAKRDTNAFESIRLWEDNLRQQSWNTFLPNSSNSSDFIFAFQSAWQKQQLINHGRGMIMVDSTHNSVDNGILEGGRTFSLYTVMIRDPVVGKGLPALLSGWEPVEAIMRWLRHTTGIVPRAVMSDCALAIKKGITDAFSDLGSQAPKVYWCIFHVLRAYMKKAKSHLHGRANEAVKDFRRVLYDERLLEVRLERFYEKWSLVNPNFVAYVRSQWQTNIVNWAMAYRLTPHQGIHTNNYTEAWHRILKTHFINTGERRRIDEVVQVLTDEVHTSYLMSHIQVAKGLKFQRTNKFQSFAKAKAEGYNPIIMALLGINFFIDSFTNPSTNSYVCEYEEGVNGKRGRINNCTCEYFIHYGSACKHMYYLSQTYSMLVVETPFGLQELVNDVPAPPDTTHWVPDETAIRQELDQPRQENEARDAEQQHGSTKRPRVADRAKSTETTRPGADDSEPLMTEEDISQLLAMRTVPLNDRGMTAYRDPAVIEMLSEDEKARYILNLIASVVAAMKAAIDILKFVKNRRMISDKSSPDTMWWFHNCCNEVMKAVADHCQKASKPASAQFPGIAVVQVLPYNEINRLINRLQDAGFKALDHAHGLLTHKVHKEDFIASVSDVEVRLLQRQCWDVLGMVTNTCPGVVRHQIR